MLWCDDAGASYCCYVCCYSEKRHDGFTLGGGMHHCLLLLRSHIMQNHIFTRSYNLHCVVFHFKTASLFYLFSKLFHCRVFLVATIIMHMIILFRFFFFFSPFLCLTYTSRTLQSTEDDEGSHTTRGSAFRSSSYLAAPPAGKSERFKSLLFT